MSYITPIHRPSSVRLAISARLRSPDALDLVIAVANRVEVWALEPTQDGGRGLRKVHTEHANATVSMLQRLHPKDSITDLLFVGTDRFESFTACWDEAASKLVKTQRFSDIGEKHMRDSQTQDRCVVDPTGKFMAIHLWEGVLNIVRAQTRKGIERQLEWLEQVRITELLIRCSTFLYSETGHPKIAFLFQGKPDVPDSQLAVYRITEDDRNSRSSKFDPSKDREISLRHLEPGATLLIPVEKVEEEKRHNVRNPQSAKAYLGGLIVVGETSLVYIDCLSKAHIESPLKEASIFVAWAAYDVTHYFLADDYGYLHLLTIDVNGVEVVGMGVRKIGNTPRANGLVYLGNGYLFVASHHGNSTLVQIDMSFESVTVVQKIQNLAPILDFCIMDMGNTEGTNQLANEYSSGQARIVAGCGVWDDGVLSSVRSGVGLEDVGIMAEMRGVRDLFPIHTPRADVLLVSLPTETRGFKFDRQGGVEELVYISGLTLNTHTILVRQLPGNRLLHIVPTRIYLLEMESGAQIEAWNTPIGSTITRASANDRYVMVAVEGRTVHVLDINSAFAIRKEAPMGNSDQVACVHASPANPDFGVIGVWSGSVSLVELRTLSILAVESLHQQGDASPVPQDLALVCLTQNQLSLFIALSDGIVMNFTLSPSNSLLNRKSVVLGTRHSKFHLMPGSVPGTHNIFSTSEHPSLIYASDEGKVVYASVNAEGVKCVCPFDIPAFPRSIVLATDEVVKISQVDTERRTHVISIGMKEVVRRVAYSPKERVFGIGTIKRELKNGEEVISSSFRLVDDVIKIAGKPFPLDDSPATEMIEAVIRAELPDSCGNLVERFLVGTSYMDVDETVRLDVVNGRILVLGVDVERSPYLIAQHKLKGSCRRLGTIGDKIVASLSKVVAVFSYTEESTLSGKLEKIASYRPSTSPVDMAIHGNMIGIGDLMKSMILVEYVPSKDGVASPLLVERARHLQSAWTTSIAYTGDDNWLLSDANGNLMTLRQNINGATDNDKRRMEATSEYNLGEMVNRIRELEVDASPNAIVVPRAFVGTVEGGIYLYGTIAPARRDLLIRFQENVSDHTSEFGKAGFKAYRSFRNEEREAKGPYRFVDGELLEGFLDVNEEIQKDICRGLGPSVEDMRNLVEELKRIH